ncbi:MAG: hypothetical protein RLY86_557 [Pseudomonadota bacterium]|jgi:hypothetical protein
MAEQRNKRVASPGEGCYKPAHFGAFPRVTAVGRGWISRRRDLSGAKAPLKIAA